MNGILNQPAVTFPEQIRVNNQAAWAYWYNLIPYPYNSYPEWNNATGRDIYSQDEQPIGIELPPNKVTQMFIRLDQDTAFRLINFKYTVFEPTDLNQSQLTGQITGTKGTKALTGSAGAKFDTELVPGQHIVLENVALATFQLYTVDTITDFQTMTVKENLKYDYAGTNGYYASLNWYRNISNDAAESHPNIQHYIPLTRYVKVGVNFPCQQSRYMYGGTQEYFRAGGFDERLRPISCLQGEKNGVGTIRTASLLPHEGTIMIKAENLTNTYLYINGTAFGYKVTLGRDGR